MNILCIYFSPSIYKIPGIIFQSFWWKRSYNALNSVPWTINLKMYCPVNAAWYMLWINSLNMKLESKPSLKPNFAKKWDPHQSHNFSKVYKVNTWFSKLFSLQANLIIFWIDEIGSICTPIFDHFEKTTQFLHWIRVIYTRRLILQPISWACPQKDLCTKNPLGCTWSYIKTQLTYYACLSFISVL